MEESFLLAAVDQIAVLCLLVDENTRKSLFKLRSSWLTCTLSSVDPAWPIKPLPPTTDTSIHVSPKFLKQSEESFSSTKLTLAQPPLTPAAAPTSQPVPAISQASLPQEQLIRQQLLAEQKQLELKMGETKDEELKEKKRCSDKKEQEATAQLAEPQRFKAKLVNSSVTKQECDKATEKDEFKTSNTQTHTRKRTRSRSRSRSPTSSLKRKDRRSPKRRTHSSSSSLSPVHKAGKPWRLEPPHGKPSQENHLSLPSWYNRPGHMGSSRPHPVTWYQDSIPGRFNDSQFEGSHQPWPSRFEASGPPHHNMMEWVDDPRHMAHGPLRGGQAMGQFDGPPQGLRFRGPIGQQLPVRYEGQGPGPGLAYSESLMKRFEAPRHFNSKGPAPVGFQQWPSHFNGPLSFDGSGHFEEPCPLGPQNLVLHHDGRQHFQNFPGHLQFDPQHNLQPSTRPMGPPIYENPLAPQQNFPMAPQHFPKPMNPQFPTPSVAFPGQQNMQLAGNFSMQPQFSQPGPATFYNPAAPAVGPWQPVMGNMNQPSLPQNPVPFPQQNLQVGPPENHLGQVDMNNLMSKLISAGIIKPSHPEAASASCSKSSSVPPAAPPVKEEQGVEEEDIPDLTSFNIDKLKKHYETAVTQLYSGKQCSLCSMRFPATQTDLYTDHLDWHFRQNHAGKVANKKVKHRGWYCSVTDWIKSDESAKPEKHTKSQFFEENKEKVQKNQAKEKEFQSVSATKGQVGECCENCQEPFETYWVEEEEDWLLKNTIKVEDKKFHPACFEDYKNNMLS